MSEIKADTAPQEEIKAGEILRVLPWEEIKAEHGEPDESGWIAIPSGGYIGLPEKRLSNQIGIAQEDSIGKKSIWVDFGDYNVPLHAAALKKASKADAMREYTKAMKKARKAVYKLSVTLNMIETFINA